MQLLKFNTTTRVSVEGKKFFRDFLFFFIPRRGRKLELKKNRKTYTTTALMPVDAPLSSWRKAGDFSLDRSCGLGLQDGGSDVVVEDYDRVDEL